MISMIFLLLRVLGENDSEIFMKKFKKLICSLLLNKSILEIIDEWSMGGDFAEMLFKRVFLFARGNFLFELRMFLKALTVIFHKVLLF